jgi:acetoin utilization protein AcuC
MAIDFLVVLTYYETPKTMDTDAKRPGTAYIVSESFKRFTPPAEFPYEVDRGTKILEFCRKLGMMDRPWMSVIDAQEASIDELRLFHSDKYLEALGQAGQGNFLPAHFEYGLGSADCPIFKGLLDYARIAVGATLTALRALYDRRLALAFNPAGGLHHAGRERAEGFCYVNDIVVSICWLRTQRPGIRICYVDVDAHHANGVQDAFYEDDDVLVISMHQTGRTIYPGTGFEQETGQGRGQGYTINIPLEPKADDDIFQRAMDEIIMPAVESYDPDLVVAQLGVDMLHSDPLTDLNVTNSSYAYAVKNYMALGRPLLALGGGGYNRNTDVKTNALLWSIMNGIEGEEDARGLVGGVLIGDPGISDVGLREPRRYTLGAEKESVSQSLDRTMDWLKRNLLLLNR